MNGIEKLKQLTNVYRAALKEGIASDGWVQRVNDLDRYAQFRALNDLIRTIEVWLDGCKMIDIEIW